MKPRRVLVKLELETDLSLNTLRNKEWWRDGIQIDLHHDDFPVVVHQAQVNVAKFSKPGKKEDEEAMNKCRRPTQG